MKVNREIRKQAVRDFYRGGGKDIGTVVKYLIRRNKPKLTEEQKNDLWYIQENLKDKAYKDNMVEELALDLP